jgi:hypothetical protein
MEKSMSLLEELESQGVTAEDLEKAASVRLFEKAAAAEGVDLDSLDADQVEELYAVFLSNQSYSDNTKEASAMNDEIIDLFEKTAAAEGIDLDEMGDHELAELYNHYVENVLPEQVGEYDEVGEAHDKLAEAEILGRHMARAYMDELEDFDKVARARWKTELGVGGAKPKSKASGKRWQGKYRQEAADKLEAAAGSAKQRKQQASAGARRRILTSGGRDAVNKAAPSLTMKDKAQAMAARGKYRLGELAAKYPRAAKAAPYVAGGLAAGGLAAGAYHAGQKKSASFYGGLDDDALILADLMMKEASGVDYDSLVEERAFEILGELGLLD